jgi:hypothetical protein
MVCIMIRLLGIGVRSPRGEVSELDIIRYVRLGTLLLDHDLFAIDDDWAGGYRYGKPFGSPKSNESAFLRSC